MMSCSETSEEFGFYYVDTMRQRCGMPTFSCAIH